jgi:hypothetical protein
MTSFIYFGTAGVTRVIIPKWILCKVEEVPLFIFLPTILMVNDQPTNDLPVHCTAPKTEYHTTGTICIYNRHFRQVGYNAAFKGSV